MTTSIAKTNNIELNRLWAYLSLRVFFPQRNIAHSCSLPCPPSNLDLRCGTFLGFFFFSCLSPDPSCFLPCHSAFSILKAINTSFLITLPVPLPFTTNPSPLPFLLPLLCWFQPNHPSFKLHCFSRPWPAPSSSIHLWSELALAAKYFKCGDTVYWLFFYLFF